MNMPAFFDDALNVMAANICRKDSPKEAVP
jgi:hypothetical protein